MEDKESREDLQDTIARLQKEVEDLKGHVEILWKEYFGSARERLADLYWQVHDINEWITKKDEELRGATILYLPQNPPGGG
jgi:hypothetical protein